MTKLMKSIVLASTVLAAPASADQTKDGIIGSLSAGCSAAGIPKEACGPAAALVYEAGSAAYGVLKRMKELPRTQWVDDSAVLKPLLIPGQSGRASFNLEFPHSRSGSSVLQVQVRGVRAQDLNRVRFTLMADKPHRHDGVRSDSFGHGDIVRLMKKGSHDRALYLARVSWQNNPGIDIRKEFLLHNPDAEVVVTRLWTGPADAFWQIAPPQCKEDALAFEHTGYWGKKLYLNTDHSYPDLRWHGFNDKISSICLPSGWELEIFEHLNGEGKRVTIKGPKQLSSMPRGWNDTVTSIRVGRK